MGPLPLLLFAITATVKLDQAQLRAGCEARDEVVATLPSGAPVEIRFAMTGSTETCYKVSATVDGKSTTGYLPASALQHLDAFDKARQSGAAVEVSRAMQSKVDEMRSSAVTRPPDHPTVKASTLLQQNQPREALAAAEQALRMYGRDFPTLVLAGIAAYKSDDVRRALDYLKEANQIRPDRSVEMMIARLEKESKGDKSGERLYGNRFVLRYEGTLDPEVARAMVGVLEQEFSRVAATLGCRTDDRIVTIVQSREAYRASTDAAEWSGGQFDGKIRIPLTTGAVTNETRRAFAHEIVHACLANLGHFPAWLHEGMAQKLSGDTLPGFARNKFKSMAKAGHLPKLGNMSQSWSRMSSEHAAVAYAYSLAAVDQMMERYAAYGIQNILRAPDRIAQIEAELDKLLAQ